MISTVGDLLNELRNQELKTLEPFRDVGHGPVIGDMFEGLTRDLLDRALFAGLDLHVREGFLRRPDGALSRQIDCMIVQGEGVPIPHTDHWIYPVDAAIAIVEVKTSMYREDIADAHANLLSVKFPPGDRRPKRNVVARNFRGITKTELPQDLSTLPPHLEMIAHILVVEAVQPLRVALGHFGYASEHALRKGFVEFLGANVSTTGNRRDGFGPASLPDLVLCRDHGLVKLNGLPYSQPLTEDGSWPLIFSFSGRPFLYLLEALWTRLSLRVPLPAGVWGEDLEFETGNPLLDAKILEEGGRRGWEYNHWILTAEELAARPQTVMWEPVEVSEAQVTLLLALGQKGAIDPKAEDFAAHAHLVGSTPEDLAADFLSTGLVYQDDHGRIRYLTEECAWATLPDGRIVAAENKDGRLLRWVQRLTARG